MKRFTESKFGLEYLWDEVITPANDNGVQCIVDDNADGGIYLYDPIKKQWATSQTLKEFRVDVTDAIEDRDTYGQAWLDCRDPEFRDFAIKWDELQKKSDADNVYKTKKCELIRLAANEATLSDGDMDDNVSEWYAERFPDDDLAGRINKQVTFQDVMDCIDYGADIYDLLETFDSTIRERLFAELSARTGIEYGKLYRKWLKNSAFDESGDSKDMKEDDYDSPTDDEEYKDSEEYEDDPNDWSASGDEVEVQWMIDDKELGIESGDIETVVIDLGLVDCFEELVYQVELALEKAHGGMRFDYYDEWILVDADNLLKRFGYNMNESESNGGTMDVTLTFTHGHYGKKLKAGEERTIKVDPSTAPKLYDEDDFMTWIADVASDQVPGGGCFTKYDFEIPDEEAYKIIKAVNGDEGFGPDVDVDFEDFEPEDVPSEISYGDALKFYKKMHDAYDDRKLDYTKYDKIRKRLMDAIVKGLLKEKSLDELADEWFINYGTMNGWGWKTSFKYNVACALHEIHKKKHPDEHVPDRVDTVRGWHEDNCSCGLCSSCDSSD